MLSYKLHEIEGADKKGRLIKISPSVLELKNYGVISTCVCLENCETDGKSVLHKEYVDYLIYFRCTCRKPIPVAARSKCGSAAVCLLGLRLRIRGHGCLSCECCVLSGKGLCVGLITRPEEFYRL
jgi:hypothetical protein